MPELIIEYFVNHPVDTQLLLDRYILGGRVCSVFTECDARYIVPTERKARRVRAAIAGSYGGAQVGDTVMTLDNLIDRVASFAASGPRLNETKRAVIIEDVLMGAAAELPLLGGRRGFSGYVTKISQLIAELKQNAIPGPGALRSRFDEKDMGVSHAVFSDFITVFERYAARTAGDPAQGARPLLDREDVIYRCVEYLNARGFQNALPGVGIFVWDGFYDFNPLQKMFLSAAVENAARTVFALQCGGRGGAGAGRLRKVFPLPDSTAAFLSGLGADISENYNTASAGAVCRPAASENLFVSTIEAKLDLPPGSPAGLIKARDRENEVRRIAAVVKKDLVDGVAAAEDIKVVFPALDRYMPLVRLWFPRYGVPYTAAAGESLGVSPVAGAFLSMLDTVESGFARTAVYAMAASAFFSFDALRAAPDRPFSAWRMDTLAREALIVGGKAAGGPREWLHKFDSHRRRLLRQLEFCGPGDNGDTRDADGLRGRIDELDFYRGFFVSISDLLAPLTGRRNTIDDYFDGIRSILDTLDFQRNVYEGGAAALGETDRASNAAALSALFDTLDDCRSALSLVWAGQSVETADLNSHARVAVRTARYIRPGMPGGVEVMGLYETRGLDIRRLYMGGLVDGEFPSPAGRPFLFKNEDRRRLGLKSIQSDPSEDRLLFHSLVSSVPSLVLSYPQWDGEAECVRSDFLTELERVADFEEIAPPEPGKPFSLLEWQRSIADCAAGGDAASRERIESSLSSPAAARHADSFGAMLRGCVVERRRGGAALGAFDGRVRDPELLEYLHGRFIGAGRAFSATRLETYARCPFRFFCSKYVLNLAAPEEVEEEISPLTTGSLVHEVLERFYKNRHDPETGVSRRVTRDNIEEAKREMLDIAVAALDDMPFSGFFWERYKEQLLEGLGESNEAPEIIGAAGREYIIERPPGMLLKFLLRESDLPPGLHPAYFETEFPCEAEGGAGGWMCEVDGGRVCFSGVVDRIDVAELGGGRRGWMIVDYKTGAPRNIKLTLDGLDFQLPLYMLLASSMMASGDELIGAAYDSLKPGHEGRNVFIANDKFVSKKFDDGAFIVSTKRSGPMPEDAFLRELDNAQERVKTIVEAIVAGHFHTTFESPATAGCAYCEFSRICRLDTVRMEKALEAIVKKEGGGKMYIRGPLWEEAAGGTD